MLPLEGWLFTNRDQVYTNSMWASIPKAVSAEVRYPAGPLEPLHPDPIRFMMQAC